MSIYSLNMSDNIPSDAAGDYPSNGFYNPSYLGKILIVNGATCTYEYSSITTGGTIQIRTADSGGGDGITISLDSTNQKGSTTSVLTVPANTTLYTRFTNCNQLGGGQIDLNLFTDTSVSLYGISDDDLTAMLGVCLGREITPKELNYFKRTTRMSIMSLINLPEMEFSYDLTVTTGIDSYDWSTIDANFKEEKGVWLLDSNDEPSVEIIKITDFNRFNELKSSNLSNQVSHDQVNYGMFQRKIWFTPNSNNNKFRIYGYKYLPDTTGTTTDTLNTYFAKAIELFVQSNAIRLKNNATSDDVQRAMHLESWGKDQLKISADSQDGKKFANMDTKRKG